MREDGELSVDERQGGRLGGRESWTQKRDVIVQQRCTDRLDRNRQVSLTKMD